MNGEPLGLLQDHVSVAGLLGEFEAVPQRQHFVRPFLANNTLVLLEVEEQDGRHVRLVTDLGAQLHRAANVATQAESLAPAV